MRTFSILLFLTVPSLAQEAKVSYRDARELTVEGQGWSETKDPYDRLPQKAKETVRPSVWSLGQRSAGICVRFRSNASAIHAKWALTSPNLAMPHMPATGVSGLDLYARDEKGQWRWVANGRPTAKENTSTLVSGMTQTEREWLLYLPLYNGVTKVEVGVPDGSTLTKGSPRPTESQKPIVFYGTSITQGGCASRPGMVHTAIVGRWLDRPVINLGFSGNGRMEKEVAELMREIDAAAYVIDCLPNIGAKEVTERTAAVVNTLRTARPHVPIILVEDRNYTNSTFVIGKQKHNLSNQSALRDEYEKLLEGGCKELYYIEAKDLLGNDGEGTVDSSHPTDLGFMRQAKVFHKVLRQLVPNETPAR